MSTQASLFEDSTNEPAESLEAINREIREKGEAAFREQDVYFGSRSGRCRGSGRRRNRRGRPMYFPAFLSRAGGRS